MKIEKSIFYSRFVSDPNGNGGDRRTYQLFKALSCFNPQIISLTANLSGGRCHGQGPAKNFFAKVFSRFLSVCNEIRQFLRDFSLAEGEYRSWQKRLLTFILSFRMSARNVAASFPKNHPPDLVLLDDPIFFAPLARKINKLKIPLVGICHNIETLVYGQVPCPHRRRKLFEKEISVLSLCDLVITISRVDALFLNNFGVRAFYFPFYPSQEKTADLLKVRDRRKTTVKNDFFLLGSACNPPTKAGMRELIQTWKNVPSSHTGQKLIVAGYETHELKSACQDPGICFLGTITNDELYERLSTVKALVCYQVPTTGSLTRIPEALIAGVPVLANFFAARSNYLRKGVVEFLNPEDLGQAIKKVELEEGNIPVPEPPDTHLMISEILKAVRKKNDLR